jgi:hypothetical protein
MMMRRRRINGGIFSPGVYWWCWLVMAHQQLLQHHNGSYSQHPGGVVVVNGLAMMSTTTASTRETAATIWQWDMQHRPRPRVGIGANHELMLEAVQQALLLIDALAPPPVLAMAVEESSSTSTTYSSSSSTIMLDDAAEDRRQDAMTVLMTSLRDYTDAPEHFYDYIFDILHTQLNISPQLYTPNNHASMIIRPPVPSQQKATNSILSLESTVQIQDQDEFEQKRQGWRLDHDSSRRRRGNGGGASTRRRRSVFLTNNQMDSTLLRAGVDDPFLFWDDETLDLEEGNNDQAWLQREQKIAAPFLYDSIVDPQYTEEDANVFTADDDDDDDDDQLRLEEVLRTNLSKVLSSTLTPQQLLVLRHVYGLTTTGTTTSSSSSSSDADRRGPMTIDATAIALGLSSGRVQRLLDRAMDRLRKVFAEMYLSRRNHNDDDDDGNGNDDDGVIEEDST